MKLAVISGASRGLGAELYRQYQDDGWQTLDFSRSAPHPGSHAVDLSQPESAAAEFDRVLGAAARQPLEEVLIISNAATLQPIGLLERLAPEEIIAATRINITSGLLLMRAALAAFGRQPLQRLRLAAISSGAARHGYAGWSLYCAGKAAMENAQRAIALEVQDRPHIDAVSIDPGLIDTGMQTTIRRSSRSDFPAVDKFIRRHQDGLLQPPPRVAAAVRRICSLPELEAGAIYRAADYF
ncbi:SDR family NAD(P)-dependent oxidoreductase [Spirochaeta africana]|uniref:Short-chain alcohol dehydrogenase n=1 Tax=Spirochaeta africana (strain ATCC 700263 / DSM 8902 / Z-7692) TaxID=889378 RepID=H9ULM8_SPIAZ|nr:SDR family NAD(P)-dependent oxidoreductase [Spirochaeta africana]AFG38421.1 dehydrogenase of unknown specificity, short-chain alcohol dehydrogenase like protein [Spirochaeta africana DSM 8902]